MTWSFSPLLINHPLLFSFLAFVETDPISNRRMTTTHCTDGPEPWSAYDRTPGSLFDMTHSTLGSKRTELKRKGFKCSFRSNEQLYPFLYQLRWPWKFPWREEQRQILDSFLDRSSSSHFVLQAIFGGGKTTMLIAILLIVRLVYEIPARQIGLCAYNVSIRNELEKKTRSLGRGLSIFTYDSLVWHLCQEMGYPHLSLLNFETKRAFVWENRTNIRPLPEMRYIFVDECQDLEKRCLLVLQQRFPCAIFFFAGDMFQSIQKEPRESLLWYLLYEHSKLSSLKTPLRIYFMKTTPRVPSPILSEIKQALQNYYPEWTETIEEWKSSRKVTTPPFPAQPTKEGIEWNPFSTYSKMYESLVKDLKQQPSFEDCMVLVFSSAITVRGCLGDIARFRKTLEKEGIPVNTNHKRMVDNKLFLSTANSSKGLERKYVYCVLTFPLELAFANLSNDVVMNLITVALSRCLERVRFYVTTHHDRFSSVLSFFEQCPRPCSPPHTEEKDTKECGSSSSSVVPPKKQPMIARSSEFQPSITAETVGTVEHGVTEILRQQIFSFELRRSLAAYARKGQTIPIPSLIKEGLHESFRTEEACAFLGVLFESLLLSEWSHRFPPILESYCHDMFDGQRKMIQQLAERYRNQFLIQPFASSSHYQRFQACLAYSEYHLFATQKVHFRVPKESSALLYQKWETFRTAVVPAIHSEHPAPSRIKTQENLKMPGITGIADAVDISGKQTVIYEIKASRASDWKENALLQAILYGIMMGQSQFRICLVNVFGKEVLWLNVYLKQHLRWLRGVMYSEILQWNTRCFLAKRLHLPFSCLLKDVERTLIYSECYDPISHQKKESILVQFLSPTRVQFFLFCQWRPRPMIGPLESLQEYQTIEEQGPNLERGVEDTILHVEAAYSCHRLLLLGSETQCPLSSSPSRIQHIERVEWPDDPQETINLSNAPTEEEEKKKTTLRTTTTASSVRWMERVCQWICFQKTAVR